MEDRINRTLWNRRKHGQRGFTLIELLVVIAVLAVLAAIVIFNVTGVKNKGNDAACQTDTQSVQTAVDAYLNGNGSTTNALVTGSMFATAISPDSTALAPDYLHSIPTSCTGGFTLTYANGTNADNGYTVIGHATGTTYTG